MSWWFPILLYTNSERKGLWLQTSSGCTRANSTMLGAARFSLSTLRSRISLAPSLGLSSRLCLLVGMMVLKAFHERLVSCMEAILLIDMYPIPPWLLVIKCIP